MIPNLKRVSQAAILASRCTWPEKKAGRYQRAEIITLRDDVRKDKIDCLGHA